MSKKAKASDFTSPGLPEGYKPGLEGVIAGVSAICEVDPNSDILLYRGYSANELAQKATFSEVTFLLLHGRLPTREEIDPFRQDLYKRRGIPPEVIAIMKIIPKDANPMTRLRMATSCVHMYDPHRGDVSEYANVQKAENLIARAPTLVAAGHRISKGLDPIDPNPNLGLGANFLYMLNGEDPDKETGNMFCATLVLYAEHGFNASTFAALITASTMSDMHSCVSSAIGTLKGPLHGGANQEAIEMLLKIGAPGNVDAWLADTLARKDKVPGFGHRVYKTRDTRAPIMKVMAERLAKKVGDEQLFAAADRLEQLMWEKKTLFPNVDYYSAVLYYLMGLEPVLFTPIFAMARMVGWTAHVIEQQKNNRLIRPTGHYIGPVGLPFVPLDER